MEKINAMQLLNKRILQKNCRVLADVNPKLEYIPQFLKQKYKKLDTSILNYEIHLIYYLSKVVPAIMINPQCFSSDTFLQVASYAKKMGLMVIGNFTVSEHHNLSLGIKSPVDAVIVKSTAENLTEIIDELTKSDKGIFLYLEGNNSNVIFANYASYITSDFGIMIDLMSAKEYGELRNKLSKTFFLISGFSENLSTCFDLKQTNALVVASSIVSAYKISPWDKLYCEEKWYEASRAEAKMIMKEINGQIYDDFETE